MFIPVLQKIYLSGGKTTENADDFLHIRAAGTVFKNPKYEHRQVLPDTLFEYIIDGEGYIEYDGVRYTVKKGDCVIIRSGVAANRAVAYGSSAENPYLKLWFAVCGDFLDSMFSAFKVTQPIIIKHCNALEQFQPFIISLSKDGYNPVTAMSAIAEIMYKIFKGKAGENDAAESFDKMVDLYIERNIQYNPTLATAAADLGINEISFGRYFIKRFNMSYKKYMLSQRLHLARVMLNDKNYLVSEIASTLGFYDQSYFSKCFKKEFGVYPGVYRKEKYDK